MLTHFLKLFALLIGGGTLGYLVIAKVTFFEALYMTVITVSTVGYAEMVHLDTTGRIFTMILILSSFFVLAYGASVLAAFIIEQELEQHDRIQTSRMKDRIARLRNHIIVCGLGRTGIHLLQEILETRRACVAIDINEESVRRHLDRFDFPFLIGKAFDEQVLKDAGIERAAGIAGCLPSDATNMFLLITARSLNPSIKTVCKVETGESMDVFRKAGVDYVVDPNQIGGLRMASALMRPHVVNFLDVMIQAAPEMALRIEEAIVTPDSPLIGRTIEESRIGTQTGMLVLAVRRAGKYHFNPAGATRIEANDALIVMGSPDQRATLERFIATGSC